MTVFDGLLKRHVRRVFDEVTVLEKYNRVEELTLRPLVVSVVQHVYQLLDLKSRQTSSHVSRWPH